MWDKFSQACLSGNLPAAYLCELPETMITQSEINALFIRVFNHGHFDVLKYLYETYKITCECDVFQLACLSGNLEIAKMLYKSKSMLGHGNTLFKNVCINGHLNVAKWLYSINPPHGQLSNIFTELCKYGQLDVAKWLFVTHIECQNEFNNKDKITKLFRFACLSTQFEFAKWLYEINPPDLSYNNEEFFKIAIRFRSIEFAKWLIYKKPSINISINHNYLFNHVCMLNDVVFARFMYQINPFVDIDWHEKLIDACHRNHLEITEFIVNDVLKSHSYIRFEYYSDFTDRIKEILINARLVDPSTLYVDDLLHYLSVTDGFVPQNFSPIYPDTQQIPVKRSGDRTKPARH